MCWSSSRLEKLQTNEEMVKVFHIQKKRKVSENKEIVNSSNKVAEMETNAEFDKDIDTMSDSDSNNVAKTKMKKNTTYLGSEFDADNDGQ
jgi:hypothetical protein